MRSWKLIPCRRFEFVIEVPVTLVPSRATAFDAISHLLHAALLGTLPCYDRLHHPGNDRQPAHLFSLSSLASSLVPRKTHAPEVFDSTPILAHVSSPLTVFSCDTDEGTTAYSFEYATDMDGLGDLKLSINSQQVSHLVVAGPIDCLTLQLVLGQTAAVHIDVSGLSPKTTIHTVNIDLVQTTKNASCPSKYSSSPSISSETGLPDEVIDSFQLHSFGIPWPFMHTRPRPYRGSYVWRGAEAAKYTSDRLTLGDLRADRNCDDGFGLSTTLTLPSPIIGAMATSTSCDPAFSTISHHLDVKFTYSILDQGTGGTSLARSADQEPQEGSIRTWTLEKALVVHSDLSSATATAAPPYASAGATTHHCIVEPIMDLKSTKAARLTSLGSLRKTYMRPVRMNENDLRTRTKRHWDETGGLCACFDQSDTCKCAGRQDAPPHKDRAGTLFVAPHGCCERPGR